MIRPAQPPAPRRERALARQALESTGPTTREGRAPPSGSASAATARGCRDPGEDRGSSPWAKAERPRLGDGGDAACSRPQRARMSVVWRLVSPMAARTAEQSPDLAPSPRHSMGDSFFRQARLGYLRVKGSNSNRFPYFRNLDHRKAFFSVNPVIPFIPELIPVRNGPNSPNIAQRRPSVERTAEKAHWSRFEFSPS